MKKITEYLNVIISSADISNPSGQELASTAILIGNQTVHWSGDNYFKLKGAIGDALKTDRDLVKSYSIKTFEDEAIKYLRPNIQSQTTINDSIAADFKNLLIEKPIIRFRVVRDIHGIALKNIQTILTLGPYDIFHFESHKKVYENIVDVPLPDMLWRNSSKSFLISYSVESRDQQKAIEVADISFEKFETTISFLMGLPVGEFEVGILNYSGWKVQRAFLFGDNRGYYDTSNAVGPMQQVTLDQDYFVNKKLGYDRLWELVASTRLTEIESKTLLAIQWIGYALRDPNIQSAFMKVAISLEIIFTYHEKEIINPSILYRISEGAALILGNNADERFEIEADIKKLYSIRSSIAHSGKANVHSSDYYSILKYARNVVLKLLSNKRLVKINTPEQLFKKLKKMKYSCEAI